MTAPIEAVVLHFTDIVTMLGAWGYLNVTETANFLLGEWKDTDPILKDAVRRFKERWADKYRLPKDDHLDDATIELMSRRFCNHPDILPQALGDQAIGEGLRRWAGNRITWFDRQVQVGNFSMALAMDFTIEQTAKACNLNIAKATTPACNIQATSKRLDGPGKVLAQAWLPNAPSQLSEMKMQEFDTSETALGQKSFSLVVLHETGHSMGLDHDSSSEVAVMDPYLNPALVGWLPPDVAQLQKRYGPPVASPPPPPTPTDELIIRVKDGVPTIDGYRVTKL